MLKGFQTYVDKARLFNKNNHLLLAVSGGMDSVVLADLFYKSNLNFAIAHCNFKLRKASDEDARFVAELARSYGVKYYSKDFDTGTSATKNKISIQMAARDLRYKWFEEIRQEEGFDCIAIAHNQDDIAETMMINLVRGTGLSGLTGIQPIVGKIVRPLLFAMRLEIEAYYHEHNLKHREDSSNRENKYYRNKIRNLVIPILKEMNPDIVRTMYDNSQRFAEAYSIMRTKIEVDFTALSSTDQNILKLNIAKLKELTPIYACLYEMLREYGFNRAVTDSIIEHLDYEPGKIFYSPEYQLVKDREFLLVSRIPTNDSKEWIIENDYDTQNLPIALTISLLDATVVDFTSIDNNHCYLDASKVCFPLTMRRWRPGDRFQPLGMKNFKKISDFFIDIKLSRIEKDRTWLLTQGNQIIWIIGHRMDNRFRITEQTRVVMRVEV